MPPAHPPRPVRPGCDDPGKVAVIEPDDGQVDPPGGEMHQPGREPGAAHLDQVGPLVRHDPAGRSRRQHEAVGLLGRNRRAVQPVTADAARLEDLVPRAGHHDGLAQLGPPLDVARLLQQVGADAAGGLAEELGDVEHAELGGGPEPGRQLEARDVQGGARARRRDQLQVQHPARGRVSQSSPRAGRPCRSSGRGSCSPRPSR